MSYWEMHGSENLLIGYFFSRLLRVNVGGKSNVGEERPLNPQELEVLEIGRDYQN